MTTTPADLAVYGIALMLCGLGICLTFATMWAVLWTRTKRARDLKPTMGALLETGITQVRGPKSSEYWQARVRYQYTVAGVEYHGNRISLDFNSYRTAELARAALNAYPIDRKVTIWYDPQKPGWSTLNASMPEKSLLLFGRIAIISLIISLVGIWMLVTNFRA